MLPYVGNVESWEYIMSKAEGDGFAEASPTFEHGLAEAGSLWSLKPSKLLERIMSTSLSDSIETAQSVRTGLPISEWQNLIDAGLLDESAVAEANLLSSEHVARAKKAGNFDAGAAQRIIRVIRVTALARDTFGADAAKIWLSRETPPLGNKSPLSLLDTDEGARAVETLIGRIDHGIAA